jgi:hypothetical protein
VLGRGFLGLINRIKAREILTLEPGKNVLLLRFSRTAPDFLAVSCVRIESLQIASTYSLVDSPLISDCV